MRKALVFSFFLCFAIFLALAPRGGGWKWTAHWTIAEVVYGRVEQDTTVPAFVKNNLDWTLINAGAVAPDRWRLAPYYADEAHKATYVKERGEFWLRAARDNWAAGAFDNASYYLGIASHYWGDVTCFAHHDNCRSYYENIYGSEIGYDVWDRLHDHNEWQVAKYVPSNPSRLGSYVNLDNFTDPNANFLDYYAEPYLSSFIDNVMPPITMPPYNVMGGWWGEWLSNRDCNKIKWAEDESVRLIYNGWYRALRDGYESYRILHQAEGLPAWNWPGAGGGGMSTAAKEPEEQASASSAETAALAVAVMCLAAVLSLASWVLNRSGRVSKRVRGV